MNEPLTEKQCAPGKHWWVPIYRAGRPYNPPEPLHTADDVVCQLCGKHQENPFE